MGDKADPINLLKNAKDDSHLLSLRLQLSFYLVLITSLSGLLPLTLKFWFDERRIRSLASTTTNLFAQGLICGAAGVELANVFLCALPTSRAYFTAGGDFPNAEMSMGFGFLVVFFLQEIVFYQFGNTDADYVDQWHLYLVQFIRCELNVLKHYVPPPVEPSYSEELEMGELRELKMKLERSEGIPEELQAERPSRRSLRTMYLREVREHRRITHPELNGVVLFGVVMLSAHSILDGFALGSQPTSAHTFYAFSALGIQRIIIAIATSAELTVSNFSFKDTITVLAIYSVMPAAGSLIATILDFLSVPRIVLAVLNSYSGGGLLYVIFCELLRGHKSRVLLGAGQSLSAFTGYACFALLSMQVLDYSHF